MNDLYSVKPIVLGAIRKLMTFVFLMFAAAVTTAAQPEGQTLLDTGIPKVLLIGDSISCQYTPYVIKQLHGKAIVKHHKGNAGPTMRGVAHIDTWLGTTEWDVIHFNWGLWDMYGWRYMEVDRSPKAYEERLETLVLRLKKTGAKLIWATTTPICPKAERTGGITLTPEIEKTYLDAAERVMKKHGIQVNDLHSFTKARRNEFALADNDVHFNTEGRKEHAKQVAKHIMIAVSGEAAAPPRTVLPQGITHR